MASSASCPNCGIVLFTPGPHDHHDSPHPMVQLPSDLSQPFTLLVNPNTDIYELQFHDEMTSGQSPRIFAMTFSSDRSNPTFTASVAVPREPNPTAGFGFTAANTGGATNLWVGAWWDDGTYGTGTRQNVIDYFTAHPYSETHHTVPIIIS